MIDKTKFERYAEIKNAIKAMEVEAKEIQDEVISQDLEVPNLC